MMTNYNSLLNILKDKMKYKKYGCHIADSTLKTSVKKWLKKNHYQNTLNVPIRRNCMTGSGVENECHRNVDNLVIAYGGKRLVGYAVHEIKLDRIDLTLFCSHSVWLTPEVNAVDVTAHNYSDPLDYSVFLPLMSSKDIISGFYDFALPNQNTHEEVWIDYGGSEFNEKICSTTGLALVRLGNYKTFVVLPSSKFHRKILVWRSELLRGKNLIQDLQKGGFKDPSTSTGKPWDEIFKTRVIPAIVPNMNI